MENYSCKKYGAYAKRILLTMSLCVFISGCNGGEEIDVPIEVTCSPQYLSYELKPGQPELIINGNTVEIINIGEQYVEQGFSAVDGEDGDISSSVVISGVENIDVSTIGDYLISYSVVDSDNNHSFTKYRMVRVVDGQSHSAYSLRFFEEVDSVWEYYEKLPDNMGLIDNEKYPLLIINHGYEHSKQFDNGGMMAMQGNSAIELLKANTFPEDLNYIILVPQRCSASMNQNTTQSLNDFLLWAEQNYPVDTSKVYMAGLSRGGYLTWDYAKEFPTKVSAIAPMVMGYNSDICPIANLPVWAFTAIDDEAIPYQEVVSAVESLAACPGNVRKPLLTVFENGGHIIDDNIFDLSYLGLGDPEYDVYSESIFEWFLKHSK